MIIRNWGTLQGKTESIRTWVIIWMRVTGPVVSLVLGQGALCLHTALSCSWNYRRREVDNVLILNLWIGNAAKEWHADEPLTWVRDDDDLSNVLQVQLLQPALNLLISDLPARPFTSVARSSGDDCVLLDSYSFFSYRYLLVMFSRVS